MTDDLVFLKLGGSLITDKATPQTARPDVIARLANEIRVALSVRPELRLLIGHGSGSFGHSVAKQHDTRNGVSTPAGWRGFAEVAAVAAALNRIVFGALREAGVPVLNLSPSASAVVRGGAIAELALYPIEQALAHGLVPLVHGDVAFDAERGGTIVSTEDVFAWLRGQLLPARMVLVGTERGVLTAFPDGELVPEITAGTIETLRPALRGSAATDVTGGMESKVLSMLAEVQSQPGLAIQILSGEVPGRVMSALIGEPTVGTLIH